MNRLVYLLGYVYAKLEGHMLFISLSAIIAIPALLSYPY